MWPHKIYPHAAGANTTGEQVVAGADFQKVIIRADGVHIGKILFVVHASPARQVAASWNGILHTLGSLLES